MSDNVLKYLSFFIGSGVLIFVARLIFTSGKYCKTIDALEKENTEINRKIDTLILSFNRLISKLEGVKNLSGLDDIYFKTSSPKNLTEVGIKMLNESGLKDFIDANKDELIKKVESNKPQTNYDIEQSAINAMLPLAGDTRLNKIKEYVFQNGKDLTMMLIASGIYLRDLIISKNVSKQL